MAMQQAGAAYGSGQWGTAEQLCRMTLKAQPQYFDALNLLGIITAQSHRTQEAADLLGRAVAVRPDQATAHCNYGSALHGLTRFTDALKSYDRALKIRPEYAEALNNRGAALQALKRFDDALDSYQRALKIKPDYAEAHNNRGAILRQMKRLEEALGSYQCALNVRPGYAEALYNRGIALHELGRFGDALDSYERALTIVPGHAEAWYNRGNALKDLRRFDESQNSYERALRIKSDHSEACNNRGIALHELRRFDEALDSYERALKINPHDAAIYNNLGVTLRELKRFDDALESCVRALNINPDYAAAHYNQGTVLQALKRLEDARDSYGRALQIKADYEWLFGAWLHTKMLLCEWDDWNVHVENLVDKIRLGRQATPPFPVLALTESLSIQRQSAETWINREHPAGSFLPAIEKRPRCRKIRVGYYSADYHNHATGYLMAELFEKHNKERFELVAFSFGPDEHDEMRERLSAAFDQFVDVRAKSDREVAQISRDLRIDIAVDLKGFTLDARTGFFSNRAAPIQVGYLGYPGTMGARYIDYIIADHTLVPVESRQYYSEKVVYLPDSYQVNDRTRQISDKQFSRAELGLPAASFVFCCFNNAYKITPGTFDGWMRILRNVEGSVLWLFEDNEIASRNLCKEAQARGVEPGRLIFAKRMPLPEHLARHRAADLFIDTLPYNAHTTASDALWAGLPVLTCTGESLAAKVAASLLNAIRLPELVTATQEQYETMAIELATHSGRLAEIREKLNRNRLTTPLFDSDLFTEHIESAYRQMYERYHAGLEPDHIYVG
jgi:predicted O-linked N-acetylglucosamine transferase (SPINDLY family)